MKGTGKRGSKTKRQAARSCLLKRSWVEFADDETVKKEHAQKHRQKRRQGASNGRNEWMRQCRRRSRRPGKDQDETAISAGWWSQKGGVIRDQEGSPAWEDKKGKAREDPLPAACQQRGPIRRTQRCSRIQLGWKIELTAAQQRGSLRWTSLIEMLKPRLSIGAARTEDLKTVLPQRCARYQSQTRPPPGALHLIDLERSHVCCFLMT